MALRWDDQRKRWRGSTNRLLTDGQVARLRDDLANEYERQLIDLADAYVAGSISEATFRRRFSELVVKATGAGYAFGRGGVPHLTDGDYALLGEIVTWQLTYADGFYADLAERLTQAALETASRRAALVQIGDWVRMRSGNYGSAVVQAYEKANVAARIGLEYVKLGFPVYPGDFGTPCRHRCRCHWSIGDEQPGGLFACVWVTERDPSVCDGCRERGERYSADSPLLLRRPEVTA